jgi:hypothetical protein
MNPENVMLLSRRSLKDPDDVVGFTDPRRGKKGGKNCDGKPVGAFGVHANGDQ